jgi:hypothetical protein
VYLPLIDAFGPIPYFNDGQSNAAISAYKNGVDNGSTLLWFETNQVTFPQNKYVSANFPEIEMGPLLQESHFD